MPPPHAHTHTQLRHTHTACWPWRPVPLYPITIPQAHTHTFVGIRLSARGWVCCHRSPASGVALHTLTPSHPLPHPHSKGNLPPTRPPIHPPTHISPAPHRGPHAHHPPTHPITSPSHLPPHPHTCLPAQPSPSTPPFHLPTCPCPPNLCQAQTKWRRKGTTIPECGAVRWRENTSSVAVKTATVNRLHAFLNNRIPTDRQACGKELSEHSSWQ